MSILEAQVSLLPRAITQAIFAQIQSPGPVWKAKTNTNLPVLIEKVLLIVNAQGRELNKMDQFIDSLGGLSENMKIRKHELMLFNCHLEGKI